MTECQCGTSPGSGHRMCVLEQHTVAGPEAPGGPVEEYALLGATGAPACLAESRLCNPHTHAVHTHAQNLHYLVAEAWRHRLW